MIGKLFLVSPPITNISDPLSATRFSDFKTDGRVSRNIVGYTCSALDHDVGGIEYFPRTISNGIVHIHTRSGLLRGLCFPLQARQFKPAETPVTYTHDELRTSLVFLRSQSTPHDPSDRQAR